MGYPSETSIKSGQNSTTEKSAGSCGALVLHAMADSGPTQASSACGHRDAQFLARLDRAGLDHCYGMGFYRRAAFGDTLTTLGTVPSGNRPRRGLTSKNSCGAEEMLRIWRKLG